MGEKFAKSSDVVYHEYTHNVIFHIYSGWIGLSGQAGAMNEGLSDYYACSINNDPILGESVELFRDLSNSLSYIEGLGIHRNGKVIGGAIWDMRQSPGIGVTLADELLFGALERTPQAHDFANLLDNVLYEDDDDGTPSNGTPNIDEILYAFENHSIYPGDQNFPPAKPKNLEQTASSGNPVLVWDANTEPDLQGYHVYRSDKSSFSPNTKLTGSPISGTSYTGNQIIIGGPRKRYYRVKAIDDSSILSNWSNQVDVNGMFGA